jgi:hypothetical protein
MRKLLIILLICFCTSTGYAQQVMLEHATITVQMPESTRGWYVPVSIDLDSITKLPAGQISIREERSSRSIEIPSQVENGKRRRLYFLIPPGEKDEFIRTRSFAIVEKSSHMGEPMKASRQNGALIIQAGNKNLLSYQYETMYPPKGVDTNYKRSGFIHPLWSPRGQVLTRVQPPDHYHHYGIWNPWTHVLYKNDTVDFWNIRDKKGTVRFAGFANVAEGKVFSGFTAKHDHVVFHKDGTEETAIKELQTVRIYQPDPKTNYYIADFDIEMECATSNPVLLLEYRYGGFGWRTTEKWDNKNSEVITSDGKTRKDADGSKATWCIVQGAIDNDTAGVVMMSYPANYNHPEPLRIWPENQYNRGDMFANFSPTKDKNWLLEPGKKYRLKYRLLVYNGKYNAEKAAAAWQQFAQPLAMTIKK